jgi:glycosyltransferase involved in cell wall biosynthesis
MTNDLICVSHLRWNFVYQRPQHLLSRFGKKQRVFYIEEPGHEVANPHVEINNIPDTNVWIIVPHLTHGSAEDKIEQQKVLLDKLISDFNIHNYILWYYFPMAISFSKHLKADLIVYDCMDELSAFKFAPPQLKQNENLLFEKADIVFTGGHNLYRAKKTQHANVYPMPSSIDKQHFSKARNITIEPADQKEIPHPRLGFYGVLDERFDIELLKQLSALQPDWHFIMLGPVVKIDAATLPRNSNIHYLGGKDYKVLPDYLAGWDIALIAFAINESTEFISPTKTPEYLAGGKPVISTPIKDVIDPYGNIGLVKIAATAEEFSIAGMAILKEKNTSKWLKDVDIYLEDISWDKTWENMNELMDEAMELKLNPKKINYV